MISRTIDTATFLRRPNVVRAHSRAAVKLATGCTWFVGSLYYDWNAQVLVEVGNIFCVRMLRKKDGNMKGVLKIKISNSRFILSSANL